MSSVTVWKPGQEPLPAAPWKGTGRPTKYLRRNRRHTPITVKDLAFALPRQAWKQVSWREGTRSALQSRFAAVRVRPVHRDFERTEPYPELARTAEHADRATPLKSYCTGLLLPGERKSVEPMAARLYAT